MASRTDLVTFVLSTLLLASCHVPAGPLDAELARLGHRNLVAVVDSAYPAQTNPGITTQVVGGDQVEVLRRVLTTLRAQGHVQPRAFLDAELDQVTEAASPGIVAHRANLLRALAGVEVVRTPHADLIGKLATTAEKFEVLVLKTDLKLPYTSVFLELECGYWDGAREAELRRALDRR